MRPEGAYEGEAVIDSELSGDWVLRFTGEDGRRASVDFSTLPLPGLYRPLAKALATVCGPQGSVRSVSAVKDYTAVVRRFVKILADFPDSPATLATLTVDHCEAYRRVLLTTASERNVSGGLRLLSTVFQLLMKKRRSSRAKSVRCCVRSKRFRWTDRAVKSCSRCTIRREWRLLR